MAASAKDGWFLNQQSIFLLCYFAIGQRKLQHYYIFKKCTHSISNKIKQGSVEFCCEHFVGH